MARSHVQLFYHETKDSRVGTTSLYSSKGYPSFRVPTDRVSNAVAPEAYSTWNLPPNRPFSKFISNPPTRDGSLGHRVRPSPKDIEALIAPLRSLPGDERQTHFEMPASTDDAEMDVVLSLLAEESSNSTRT
jgi:hypothetical protein